MLRKQKRPAESEGRRRSNSARRHARQCDETRYLNRRELKDCLVAAGVPDGDYFIVEVDSSFDVCREAGGALPAGMKPACPIPERRAHQSPFGSTRPRARAGRAVAVARQFRDAEGLSIPQIADRLRRS